MKKFINEFHFFIKGIILYLENLMLNLLNQ